MAFDVSNPKEPERLQISCNFSWDTTLSSLTPAAVDQVYESSEDEEEDQSKVNTQARPLSLFVSGCYVAILHLHTSCP